MSIENAGAFEAPYVGLVNDHARFCFRYKELKGMM